MTSRCRAGEVGQTGHDIVADPSRVGITPHRQHFTTAAAELQYKPVGAKSEAAQYSEHIVSHAAQTTICCIATHDPRSLVPLLLG